jgi:hypothetical protein
MVVHTNLSQFTEEQLADRLRQLAQGPASLREAHEHFCGCDEDCPWDSSWSIEREIMRRVGVSR